MGKKKRGHPDIEEVLTRPWCYYCERDFDDLKILIDHQRAKHFKCERCGRRLNTAGGLSVHMTQVHKETLASIENALPNRSNLDVEIFGTEGIPDDVTQQHRQRVLQQFAEAEANRRASGNTASAAAGSAAKKPKFESPSDLKTRLAEHKAKVAAQAAAGEPSAGNSSPAPSATPPQGPPNVPLAAQNGFQTYPQPYPAPPQSFQPPQQPIFSGQPPGQHSILPFNAPPAFSPPQQYGAYMPPGQPGQYPPAQYHPPIGISHTPFGQPPQPYGVASPSMPYGNQGQFQPPRMASPAQAGFPHNIMASPAGLPQRPAFGTPPVNAFQMQQMHQGQVSGQIPGQQFASGTQRSDSTGPPASLTPSVTTQPGLTGTPVPIKFDTGTPVPPVTQTPFPETPASATVPKKSKKDRENIKLVYSDDHVSPEEKMAEMAKYKFDRNLAKTDTVFETDSVGFAVANTVGDLDGGPRTVG